MYVYIEGIVGCKGTACSCVGNCANFLPGEALSPRPPRRKAPDAPSANKAATRGLWSFPQIGGGQSGPYSLRVQGPK